MSGARRLQLVAVRVRMQSGSRTGHGTGAARRKRTTRVMPAPAFGSVDAGSETAERRSCSVPTPAPSSWRPASMVPTVAALVAGPVETLGARLTGVPDCPVFPSTNVWNKRVDTLPVQLRRSADRHHRPGANLHPDFGSYGGYGIPINVVGQGTPRVRCASTTPTSRTAALPDPAPPPHRGRQRPPRAAWSTATPAASTSCSPPSAEGARWHAGSGAVCDLRSNRAAPGRVDQRRRRRPADPARPRALRRGRARRHRPRPALHRAAHRQRLRLPGPPPRRAPRDPALPPMGLRVRLKRSTSLAGYRRPGARRARRPSSATG